MAKHPKVTDDQLVAMIVDEKSRADYSGTNVLETQRQAADRAYAGELTDGVQNTTGLSSMLINAIQPATDTLTTYLTKIFCSDKETVVFNPSRPELAPAAKQATMLMNYIVHKQNDGYEIINRWVKDSALHKNGIVKTTLVDKPYSMVKTYTDVSMGDVNVYISQYEEDGYECEILEADILSVAIEDEDHVFSDETGNYKIKCSKMKKCIQIENVPPEEFLVNEGATSIHNDNLLRFVAHRKLMYLGDIKAMFPDFDMDKIMSEADGDYLEFEYETLNRHSSDGTYNYISREQGTGPNRQVEITESWVKADCNGDGIAEWMHVFTVGRTVLMKEEWHGKLPFSSFCFFPIPHKFYGLSVWDKLEAYHRTKTALVRGEVDVRNIQNTVRILADPRKVDHRTLSEFKPGVVPVHSTFEPGDVMVLPTPTGSPNTLQLLQYLDKEIIAQIGIDPVSGAISSDVEKSGNDAEKTSMVVDNSSAKVEMFAREFAEMGLGHVIEVIYDLFLQNADDPDFVAIVDDVTPGVPLLFAEEDFSKADLMAKVGLGHLSMPQKVRALTGIQQQQIQLQANGIAIPAQKQLNLSYEFTKAMGYENVYDFFPDMEEMEQAQAEAAQAAQNNPQAELAMAGEQAKIAKDQSQANLNNAKAENEKLEPHFKTAEAQIEMQTGKQVKLG